MEDTEVTIEQVLEWLPRHVAAEFDCVRGPHTWRETSSEGGELTYRFCLYCPRKERIGPTWPNTPPRPEPESLGAFSWRL